ncbi:MAG: hypothetical protein CMJ52_10475 [Planctomycetaceae bacterium]|nr:hypothetical protein [Planctomycetaceae bacterium]
MSMARMRLKLSLLFLDLLDHLRVPWKLLESTRKDAKSSGSHQEMMEAVLFKSMFWRSLTVRVENGLQQVKLMDLLSWT